MEVLDRFHFHLQKAQVSPSGELFNFFFTTNHDPGGWVSISLRIIKDEPLTTINEGTCNTPYCIVLSKFKQLEIDLRI